MGVDCLHEEVEVGDAGELALHSFQSVQQPVVLLCAQAALVVKHKEVALVDHLLQLRSLNEIVGNCNARILVAH